MTRLQGLHMASYTIQPYEQQIRRCVCVCVCACVCVMQSARISTRVCRPGTRATVRTTMSPSVTAGPSSSRPQQRSTPSRSWTEVKAHTAAHRQNVNTNGCRITLLLVLFLLLSHLRDGA